MSNETGAPSELFASACTRELSTVLGRHVVVADTLGITGSPAADGTDYILSALSVERAYGLLLARIHARQQVADAITALLAAGKASRKLDAALRKWLTVQDELAAANEALLFVDQWLAREAPFEPLVAEVLRMQEHLPKRSLWLTTADGWGQSATDLPAIHNVLASGENINVLVFVAADVPTSVNVVTMAGTGAGTGSLAPLRRDIGLYALNYGGVYVASCSPSASLEATDQFRAAVLEAERHPGPSLVLVHVPFFSYTGSAAVSNSTGISSDTSDTTATTGTEAVSASNAFQIRPAATLAVESGAWPLYRYNPNAGEGSTIASTAANGTSTGAVASVASDSAFTLDSAKLRADIAEFLSRENHLALLSRTLPQLSAELTRSVEGEMQTRAEATEARLLAAYKKLMSGLALPPLLVLFGSDGGNAEGVAKRLATEARKRGFTEVAVKPMDAIAATLLATLTAAPLVIFMVSTAGQGEFPMNARAFWKALSGTSAASTAAVAPGGAGSVSLGAPPAREEATVAHTAPATVVSTATPSAAATPATTAIPAATTTGATAFHFPSLRFAVFGLGDSNYWPKKEQRIFFNKPSIELEHALHAAGATRVVPRGSGDDQDVGGYMAAFKAWTPALWVALGVGAATAEAEDTSGKVRAPEDIKATSRFLRGTIAEGLTDTSTGALAYEDTLLTKFHGIYQQDDRDLRGERKRRGLEPAFSFMVRVRIPGGVASPAQYLALDSVADRYANGTIRVTTRQAVQFHGIIKGVLKPSIQAINRTLMDTLAACGDVNRNVMCTAAPQATALHAAVVDFSARLSDHLTPRTSAYHEIWIEDKLVRGGGTDAEPIYGSTYLPRKFKIAVAIPPSNDVDVFAHDLGFIAIADPATGELAGFTVTIGGGMGMTHNNVKTYPRTADEFCFATPEQAIAIAEAVVTTQRDYGDRTNRKHARLKYTVDDLGVDFFRAEVAKRIGVAALDPPRPYKLLSNGDRYGWTEAGEGAWNYTLFIQNGRIVDGKAPSRYRLKSGLRALAVSELVGEFRFTANQNIILARVEGGSRSAVDALLAEFGITNSAHTGLRLNSMACVAFPTCGLALAESERYLPTLLDRLDEVVDGAGLHDDAITIRMTGCPNGCARPYVAEIGLVGRSPGIYNLYLGAGFAGQRLNKLYREGVDEGGIVTALTPLIKRYAVERYVGEAWAAACAGGATDAHHDVEAGGAGRMVAGGVEPFGEWLIRARVIARTSSGKAFHDDLPAEVSTGSVGAAGGDAPLPPAIAAGKKKAAGEASIPE